MNDLIEKLERNARFYANEATALAAATERRDRRNLGSREAATISALLTEAALALHSAAREVAE